MSSHKFSFKDLGDPIPDPLPRGKISFKEPAPEKFSFKEQVPARPTGGRISFKDLDAPFESLSRPPSPTAPPGYGNLEDILPTRPVKSLQTSEWKKTGVFLTVNTNRIATADNAHALNEAMRRITTGEIGAAELASLFRNGRTGGPLLVGADRRPLKVTHSIEGLERGKRLHAHALIGVRYARQINGQEQKLFWDHDRFKAILLREYRAAGGGIGLDNPLPYINFRIQGLGTQDAYLYIHKADGTVVKMPITKESLAMLPESIEQQDKPARYNARKTPPTNPRARKKAEQRHARQKK